MRVPPWRRIHFRRKRKTDDMPTATVKVEDFCQTESNASAQARSVALSSTETFTAGLADILVSWDSIHPARHTAPALPRRTSTATATATRPDLHRIASPTAHGHTNPSPSPYHHHHCSQTAEALDAVGVDDDKSLMEQLAPPTPSPPPEPYVYPIDYPGTYNTCHASLLRVEGRGSRVDSRCRGHLIPPPSLTTLTRPLFRSRLNRSHRLPSFADGARIYPATEPPRPLDNTPWVASSGVVLGKTVRATVARLGLKGRGTARMPKDSGDPFQKGKIILHVIGASCVEARSYPPPRHRSAHYPTNSSSREPTAPPSHPLHHTIFVATTHAPVGYGLAAGVGRGRRSSGGGRLGGRSAAAEIARGERGQGGGTWW